MVGRLSPTAAYMPTSPSAKPSEGGPTAPRTPLPSATYMRLQRAALNRSRAAPGSGSTTTSAPPTPNSAEAIDASARGVEAELSAAESIGALDVVVQPSPPPPPPPGGRVAASAAVVVPAEPAVGNAVSSSDWRVVETPPTAPSPSMRSVAAATTEVDAASAGILDAVPASVGMLPRRRWEQPSDAPMVRGATYLDDSVKVPALGGPSTTLFAAQLFELDGEHVAGASAALLAKGALTPPADAQFVFSEYFMTPRATKTAPLNAMLLHFASPTPVEDAAGASGELLRELATGDTASRAMEGLTRPEGLAHLHICVVCLNALWPWPLCPAPVA